MALSLSVGRREISLHRCNSFTVGLRLLYEDYLKRNRARESYNSRTGELVFKNFIRMFPKFSTRDSLVWGKLTYQLLACAVTVLKYTAKCVEMNHRDMTRVRLSSWQQWRNVWHSRHYKEKPSDAVCKGHSKETSDTVRAVVEKRPTP